MDIHRIATLVGACALGVVAGHWHARIGLDTTPRAASDEHSELASTRTHPPPLLAELECTAPDLRLGSQELVFERALQQDDAARRFEGLLSAFPRLLRDDPARALQRAGRISEDQRDAIVAPALGAWAMQD